MMVRPTPSALHRHTSSLPLAARSWELQPPTTCMAARAEEFEVLYEHLQAERALCASLRNAITVTPGPLVDGEHCRREVENLVQRIATTARPVDGDTVTFREINLRFTTDKIGLLSLYQMIASGQLAPANGSVSEKLAEFAFSKEQVRSVLKQHRCDGGWTVQELAQITGWKEQSIAHWCDAGLIEHDRNAHSRGLSRVIYPNALANFQGAYVQAAVLAKQLNTTSRALVKKLNENDLKTIGSFQDGPATRGHLFALRDLVKTLDRLSEMRSPKMK